MIGLSLNMLIVYTVGLVLLVGGSFWAIIASHHPAFLVTLGMGLFFAYLFWYVMFSDWAAPRRDRQL